MHVGDSNFSRTDWSMLGHLHGEGETAAKALESLVRRYWTSIFAYIRRLGYDAEASSDLTQGFVAEIILNRRLLHRADRSRGRLRSLLIASLENFLREQRRTATRQRRTPGRGTGRGTIESIGARSDEPPAGSAITPQMAFEQAWCRILVQSVLRRVQEECERDGLGVHWQLFEARIVNPIMRRSAAVEYAELARQFELPSAVHAVNLVVTVKRRFARALRVEIESTVFDPGEVDDELVEIIGMLEGRP